MAFSNALKVGIPIATTAVGAYFGGPTGAAAGATVGGVIVGADSQKETNAANQAIAEKQMSFQQGMSNTAYQRSMADMRAAGLNPMLAYSQGGASTPSGASATMQAPDYSGIGGAVSSAIQARALKKDIEQTDSNIKLNAAAEEAKKAERLLTENSAKKVQIDAAKALSEKKMIDAKYPAVKEQSEYERRRAKMDKNFSEADAVGSRIGAIIDKINPFKWSAKSKNENPYKNWPKD